MERQSIQMKFTRQRIYAAVLALGAGAFLFRAVIMVCEGALVRSVPWVSALLVIEIIVDGIWLFASMKWGISNSSGKSEFALIAGSVAILLHALRVFIYALGQTSLLYNFDVKAEYWPLRAAPAHWLVIVLVVLALLSVIGVGIFWMARRKKRNSANDHNDHLGGAAI